MTTRSNGASRPLTGVRVIDLSTSYAGPTATSFLADLGADVIKIERSPVGDDARGWGPPFVGDASAWFHSANRNKRTLALDLRQPRDRAVLDELLEQSQILVESFNPTKLAALGLEPDDVMERHPRLIYCAISGFGFSGPAASQSGYDLAAQARSGLMSVTGAAGGSPQRVSTALSDIATGMVAALAVTAALRSLEQTGYGEFVDVSLLDTDLALMAPRIASFLAGEPEPQPSGGTDSVLAVYQAFETADRPIVVAIGSDAIWSRFCAVIGLPQLAADPRLDSNAGRREHRPEILPPIAETLKTRPASEWLGLLEPAGVPGSLVKGLSEVVSDPQIIARGSIQALDNGALTVVSPWRFGRQPETSQGAALGTVGADGPAILNQLGLDLDHV